MATLVSSDSNIIEAEETNLRLIVYPLLAAMVLIVGGFGYYYYQQAERITWEDQARTALLQAKTPEQLLQVADQYPRTTQASLALLGAAELAFGKKDFTTATADYQRVIAAMDTDAELRDSAQLGLASTLEANGKADDALTTYLLVAHRDKESPYAPFAYIAAANIYKQRNDKENERLTLSQATGLAADSSFVKEAQARLKVLNASATSTPPAAMGAVPVVPAPAKP